MNKSRGRNDDRRSDESLCEGAELLCVGDADGARDRRESTKEPGEDAKETTMRREAKLAPPKRRRVKPSEERSGEVLQAPAVSEAVCVEYR